MGFSDFIFIILILILGLLISNRTAKKTGVKLTYLLFFYHMFFSLFYYWYASNRSADANMYYAQATFQGDLFERWGLGTDFIIFISSFFVQYLHVSKLSLFFIFGFFGYIGFIYLLKLLPNQSPFKIWGIPLLTIVLFLPGFHFWTAALGKDSLFFMALMLFFYYLNNLKGIENFILLLFSWLIITFIRPHMAFILGASIFITALLRNPSKYKGSHFLLFFLSIGFAIIFYPYLLEFLSIDSLDMEKAANRINSFNQYGATNVDELNSYVDVSNYPLLLKMFTYLFRPLFFDARSVMQLIASFENLIILLIILKWSKIIKYQYRKWYKSLILPKQIMAIYVLFAWIILGASMYNLGLASRQKYMILPVIFILIFTISRKGQKQLK